jgi:hypothetical protein
MAPVSLEGESYEQWRRRTAPRESVRPVDTRPWDVGVIVLLGVFFVWYGGTVGWIGIGLVAVLVAELLVQRAVVRRGDTDPSTPPSHDRALLRVRGATLLLTVLLSTWVVVASGGEAAPLPVLLVLLDLKDDRSLLRRVLGRMRGR